jgi:hypothetical protein
LVASIFSFWGTYSFDDEGFTAKILEYLQSVSDRIIQEKRKGRQPFAQQSKHPVKQNGY